MRLYQIAKMGVGRRRAEKIYKNIKDGEQTNFSLKT